MCDVYCPLYMTHRSSLFIDERRASMGKQVAALRCQKQSISGHFSTSQNVSFSSVNAATADRERRKQGAESREPRSEKRSARLTRYYSLKCNCNYLYLETARPSSSLLRFVHCFPQAQERSSCCCIWAGSKTSSERDKFGVVCASERASERT